MQKYLSLNKYYNFALNQLAKFISPIIRRWELPKIQDYGKKPLQHQPVFIIGAPRTGSTILYQALTNLYDVLYIDNLVCRFHRNLFFGFRISNRIYGAKPHNTFKSYHGQTRGAHSPSECGQFWYRWLPRDHHFIDYDEITPLMVEKIRREITAIINYFDKPIVFKNLNAGQRMRLLTKCFPDARFLFIIRDPLQTAQSILKAKRRAGFSDHDFWSIMPPNVHKLGQLNWDVQIVKQIYFLEKQIVTDSTLAGPDNFFTIHYKDLSIRLIEELAEELGLEKRKNPQTPEIHNQEKISVTPAELNRLKTQVEALDWRFLDNHPGPKTGTGYTL
jgi:hypothetical protein